VDDKLECLLVDVLRAIPQLHERREKFDVIMIAPPQYVGLIEKTLAVIKDNDIVSPDGQIICQHDSSETAGIDFGGFPILQQRKYGNTTYTILGPIK
jgi:16S rRNA G966 N2-methylase RsmD